MIDTKKCAQNIGVIFDSDMSLEDQAMQICKRCYFQLYTIDKVWLFLNDKALVNLMHSFVTFHDLDYCSLLLGILISLLEKLQQIQNTAARNTSGTKHFHHIKPILKSLYWFPIPDCLTFKMLVTVYKCLHGLAPSYICDLLIWAINLYMHLGHQD